MGLLCYGAKTELQLIQTLLHIDCHLQLKPATLRKLTELTTVIGLWVNMSCKCGKNSCV